MDKNLLELTISAKDEQFVNALNRSEQRIRMFGDRSISALQRTGSAVKTFSDKYIGAMAGIGIGIGFAAATKDLMHFEGTLKSIRRTGGYTVEDLKVLRGQILDLMDPAKKIPLNKDEWAEMAKELHNTGIELGTIKTILPDVGKGAVASQTAPAVYGAIIGEFLDKYKITVKELPALQEQLNMAMKLPDVRKNPEAFLKVLEGLAKPMQIIGASGMENVTPLMALVAQITQISGSAEDAGAMVQSLLNGLFRLQKQPEKIKAFKTHGIGFFDKDGMKNIAELLPQFKEWADVVERHSGNMEKAAIEIMGRPEAGKATILVAKYYQEIIAKQKALQGSTGDLAKDFNIQTTGMGAQLKFFQNQIDKFKVEHMTGPLKAMTAGLTMLNNHPIFTNVALYTLLAALGIGVVGKAGSMAKGGFDFFRNLGKGGKGTEALTKGAQQMGIPVFVTNWPGNVVPGAAPGSPGAQTAAQKATPWLGVVASYLPFIAGLIGTRAALDYMDSPEGKAEGERKRAEVAAVDARLKSATSRATASEELKTAFPSQKASEMVNEFKRNNPLLFPAVTNNIDLQIMMQPGRITTQTNNANTNVKVKSLGTGDLSP